jgi:hypothetical protein
MMIVTNHFVFLHLHKSGGSFINKVLGEAFPASRQIGYHFPYSLIPTIYKKLPVLGTVRNPLDYYVSWFHYQSQMDEPNYLFNVMSDNGSLNFEETIYNLLNLFSHESLLNKVIDLAPNRFSTFNLNLTKQCFEKLRGSKLGFYSCLYQRLYETADNLQIIKLEQLREQLEQFIKAVGVDKEHTVFELINNIPDANISKRREFQYYYSSDLKHQVLEQEALLFDAHDYSVN